MKKPSLTQIRPLIISMFVGCISLSSACEAGNLNGQERGDVVFRRLVWPFEKHSAIYCEYENENPEEDSNHYVIEEEGHEIKNGARRITFQEFKSGGDYFGSMGFGYIPKEKRWNIETTAVDLIGKNYTKDYLAICVWWEDGIGGKKDGILQPDELRGLRSDAFIEYVYGLNGINISHDIINNPDWYNETYYVGQFPFGYWITCFTPNDQYNNMYDAVIDQPKPAHDFDSPSHNNAIGQWNDPQSKNPKIEVEWQSGADDDNYSGLHSYFIEWSQNRHIKITYYVQAEIVKAEDGSAVYKANSAKSRWPITDGKWWLHTRTVDQAGNWDEGHDGGASTAHYGPFFIDTTPPSISISGVSDGGTYADPVTVQYVVTDKYLEPSSVSPNWGGNTQAVDPDRIPDTGDEYVKVTASRVFEAPGNHAVTISANDNIFG